jgi:hypothetical protein
MWKRLYQPLTRYYGLMRLRTSRLRQLLGSSLKKERAAEDSRQKTARALFWADFHAGQREAEAHCSRRDP